MNPETLVVNTNSQPRGEEPSAIAPVWHTALMILLVLAPLLLQIAGNRKNPVTAGRMPSAVPFYLTGTVVLWIWFAFLVWGLRLRGGSLLNLVGGKWDSGGQLASDLAVAAGFWVLWYAVLSALKVALTKSGMTNSGGVGMVFPHGALEGALWIVSAVSAGIVEEAVFHGYLMKQFIAGSRSSAVGCALQAALFGICHGFYLGMRQVILITVSGMLIGALALRRQNLRSAMLFHCWADIFGALIIRGLPFQ